jgi:hypothetical protein
LKTLKTKLQGKNRERFGRKRMVSKRKFYKTVFMVTVLSEESLGGKFQSAQDIHNMITEGECSGAVGVLPETVLDGKDAADALIAQGSDPSFFRLTDDGEDADDDYTEPDEHDKKAMFKDACTFADERNFISDIVRNH